MNMNPKILLVDDEPNVLDGLARGLRKSFDVRTATSGAKGLEILSSEPDVTIVMSDMRMPAMNGAEFLAHARKIAPDTVRLLLTGQADMEDAILAINNGGIFRFLRKPCSPETMKAALADATDQYRLVTAEKTLLEKTLHGSIQALSDTLALANPEVFGMATRVKRTASAIGKRLLVPNLWEIEVAAMVCRLGAITVPAGVFARHTRDGALLPHELEMIQKVPEVTEQLLAPIPRLDGVREIIRHSRTGFVVSDAVGGAVRTRAEIPMGARILKVALDFEELEAVGLSPAQAIAKMRTHAVSGSYDPQVFDALAALHTQQKVITEVSLAGLRVGMLIAADVMTKSGSLLIARGHRVTPGLAGRLQNFATSLTRDTVSVESE